MTNQEHAFSLIEEITKENFSVCKKLIERYHHLQKIFPPDTVVTLSYNDKTIKVKT